VRVIFCYLILYGAWAKHIARKLKDLRTADAFPSLKVRQRTMLLHVGYGRVDVYAPLVYVPAADVGDCHDCAASLGEQLSRD
jgi:hypothetical protein